MSPQRYEAVRHSFQLAYTSRSSRLTSTHQINIHDDEDNSPITPSSDHAIPSSPPPSFRSRASSPTSRRLLGQDPLASEAEQNLADTFDDGEASDAGDHSDDRQRLMRADTGLTGQTEQRTQPQIERRITELPVFTPPVPRGQSRSFNRPTNDGVFANLAAKPERGEVLDEKPPVSQICDPVTTFGLLTSVPDVRTSCR